MSVWLPSFRGIAYTGANTPPSAASLPSKSKLACPFFPAWTACSSCEYPRCCLLFRGAARGGTYASDLLLSSSSKLHRRCHSFFRIPVGHLAIENRSHHWTSLSFRRSCCHLCSLSAGYIGRMLCWTELVTCSNPARLPPSIRLLIYKNGKARDRVSVVLRVHKRLILSFLLSGESKVLHRGKLLISICIRAANLISHL